MSQPESQSELCPQCNTPIHGFATNCLKCKYYFGVPNQRQLTKPPEQEALKQRRDDALLKSHDKGCAAIAQAFEQQVQQDSKAVINVSHKLLDDFLSNENLLMTNYTLQVEGQCRTTAEQLDDSARMGTEGTLFGSYGKEIRYAALSLDEKGLVSYGPCSVVLADITMQNSATVLQENSYTFVRNHNILPGDPVPLGYRANWCDRQLLATAKIAANLDANGGQEFSQYLLSSNGDRATDEFMEVHIYGPFNRHSIDAIGLPEIGLLGASNSQPQIGQAGGGKNKKRKKLAKSSKHDLKHNSNNHSPRQKVNLALMDCIEDYAIQLGIRCNRI